MHRIQVLRSSSGNRGSRGGGGEIEELEPLDVAGASSDTSLWGSPSMEPEEKIYVAVGKEFKESKSTLVWTLQNFPRDKKLVLVHVHRPAQLINMMGAWVPASRLTGQQVNAHRLLEKEKMNKALDEYLALCANTKVQAEKLVIDMDDVAKGLLILIAQHGITKLVMGAAADRQYSKKMKEPKSKKAVTLQKEAPPSCSIWFVCKGHRICNRTTDWDDGKLPSTSTSPSSMSVQSEPFRKSRSQVNPISLPQEAFRHNRSWSDTYDSHAHRRETIGGLPREDPIRTVPQSLVNTEGNNIDVWEGISRKSSLSSDQSSLSPSDETNSFISASVPRYEDSENGSVMLPSLHESEEHFQVSSLRDEQEDESIEDDIYRRLRLAFAEAENSKHEAYEESRRRQRAERDCLEAVRKAKVAENSYAKELKRRKYVEEIVAREKLELDNLKCQLHEVTEELRKAHEQKSALEIQVSNADHVHRGLEEKLLAAQHFINSLQAERHELQRERDDAIKSKELLLEKEEINVGNRPGQNFSAFTYFELEQATNKFGNELKIGEGGYGSVYKGVLRHTTVAIKKLCTQGMQGQIEFYQEVEILSRVRHPNLVMLIGACVEDWCLIYEFLPNGSLEDRLLCKGNTPPLSWQARIRIATEICSALIFLHSHNPHRIVHGDLKPANILLDANLVSKLGDFGISRLLMQTNSGTTLYHRTDPKGTFAYMDPEFCATGELTPGSDIYSFGIIILQLLTGKPAFGIPKEVQDALNRGTLHMILDKSAGDLPFVQAKQLAHLGLRCCEVNRKCRPDLVNEIWRILEPMKKAVSACLSMSSVSSLEDDFHAPPYFMCPIFQEVMRDPHVAGDGFTYEGEAIRGWLEGGNKTSPMTNLNLPHTELIPNHALRSAIQEWLQQQQQLQLIKR
ncbi:hypothetical protein Taro_016695, partial [Colocasia esculenta]|nr:hypothetical protein [Colocasia esculenta]